MNTIYKLTNNDLPLFVLGELLKTKDLLAELNLLIAKSKIKNPYLLTYILEKVEAISSNEIENIHTTIDEAANDIVFDNKTSPYVRYREALKNAHKKLQVSEILRPNDIVKINNCVRGKKIGFRKTPIKIIETRNQETLHSGSNAQDIQKLVTDLTSWVNQTTTKLDPVIKALLFHNQFEYIHPFTDGNGRTGRILFAIIITKYKVLEVPASIFSYSVAQKKEKYYNALKIADKGDYNRYLEIMLGIFNDSLQIAITFITSLHNKYLEIVKLVTNRTLNPKVLELLPYCFFGVKFTIKFLERKTKLNHKTITKYLKELQNIDIIKQEISGKYRPYKNLIIENLINENMQLE